MLKARIVAFLALYYTFLLKLRGLLARNDPTNNVPLPLLIITRL